mmetsp:Transcript_31600/g.77902  ORF Transcript_31600/g.77902 Transcript_31600/m.77902 type:complete len:92 (-) Transcript_31600:572-847(-)|eukprot:7036006-Prymnesium_polylepis.1
MLSTGSNVGGVPATHTMSGRLQPRREVRHAIVQGTERGARRAQARAGAGSAVLVRRACAFFRTRHPPRTMHFDYVQAWNIMEHGRMKISLR